MTNYNPGDRVIYISGVHGNADNNPLTPGDLACVGTVDSGNSDSVYGILVEWDNGTNNSYSKSDLTYSDEEKELNPNTAFRIKKRGG